MTTYAGLVRGINVGKARRLAMADSRALVEDAGFTDVRTLLNSGNVVFSGTEQSLPRMAARLETGIETRVGFRRHVVVIDAARLEMVVRENALSHADNPARLLVAFVQDTDRLEQVRELAAEDWGSESFAVGTHAAYMWLSEGILESRLLQQVGARIGTWMTTRNWTTVQKLHALSVKR